jgi:hypothetical protein
MALTSRAGPSSELRHSDAPLSCLRPHIYRWGVSEKMGREVSSGKLGVLDKESAGR